MPLNKLKNYLDDNGVDYEVIRHEQTYTAQRTAAAAHIPGKEIAKTVMIKLDGKIAMAVLPGSARVDFDMLKKATGSKKVELADETEFEELFPECETGAMPPFGNLYDLDTFVAQTLREDDEIAFNAGTHTELVRMSYADFERLVKPTVGRFAEDVAQVV